MNRKIAVAAIVGGLMHTMSVLRGQEVQPVPRERPRLPGAVLEPTQTATLTPAVADDLQRQITELVGRVQVLEQAQATSVGFTKVGNDFVFAPPARNVRIQAPQGLTIQGATSIELNAGAGMQLRAAEDLVQRAATIRLN